MSFGESPDDWERTGFKEREDMDWEEEVHIRQYDAGIVYYAVFDGDEFASEPYPPMGEDQVIAHAEGYSRAKEKYNTEAKDD